LAASGQVLIEDRAAGGAVLIGDRAAGGAQGASSLLTYLSSLPSLVTRRGITVALKVLAPLFLSRISPSSTNSLAALRLVLPDISVT
jgi:hypothetical protein